MTKEELKKWRSMQGLSQIQLGKILGVSTITVFRWEQGSRSIPPFLHLALRCIELEKGGEKIKGMKKKTKKKKEVK